MKDLVHIYELEKLLQDSCNDAVRQAKAQGQYAIGSVCAMIPEPLKQRLTILRVDDSAWKDNEQAYRVMRRLDYTRYHVYPKGFSMRISASAHREPVRIGRGELKAGLDFKQVGKLFLTAYYSHPEVLGARIFFITEPDFPYEEFGEAVRKMDSITESLNEIFNNLIVDCAACKLKPVCDEVEGLRELHFLKEKSTVDVEAPSVGQMLRALIQND